jgi:hypothetical protein
MFEIKVADLKETTLCYVQIKSFVFYDKSFLRTKFGLSFVQSMSYTAPNNFLQPKSKFLKELKPINKGLKETCMMNSQRQI